MGGTVALVAGLLAGAGTPAWADATRDAQWPLSFLNIAEAHRISQGEGVIVAVLDTGVDPTQPDLTGSVLPGLDAVTTAGDGHTDASGHGTSMAALIAGHGHGQGNADGLLGIAPKAKILPVTVWPPGTMSLRPKDVAAGIRWSVDHGAQVINISGGGMSNPVLEQAIDYAMSKNVVVIAAIGNSSTEPGPGYPGAYLDVIGVSAIDQTGNFDPAVSVQGVSVDLAAPGTRVVNPKDAKTYETTSGTSISSAMVSGVAALVKSRFPTLDAKQLIERLKVTAIDKGTPGRDRLYGWGIVDPVGALTKDVPGANGSPSAKAADATSKDAGADSDGGTGTTNKALIGVAIAGGFVVVVTVMAVSLIGLSRRRRRFPPG